MDKFTYVYWVIWIGLSIIAMILITSYLPEYEIKYEGELCEEVNFSDFDYDTTNQSDYLRASSAWNKYTFDNELKGYCRDGKRIGGVRRR